MLSNKFSFLARDVIYISRLYYMYNVSVHLSVHLSVTEVHWRIIANLGFIFRSKFTVHSAPTCTVSRSACGRLAVSVNTDL